MNSNKTTRYSEVAGLIADAAAEFWRVFSSSFPELRSGDSQMIDEDKAALGMWFIGDKGDDNPVVDPHSTMDPVHEKFTDERINRCVIEGAQAALKVWMDAGMPAPELQQVPHDIGTQLEANVRHVLWANNPYSSGHDH